MPLLDRFNPPRHPSRHWESFHSQWASEIANRLNQGLLPPEYFAEMQVHIGSRVEVDVATVHDTGFTRGADSAGVATLERKTWTPPAPAMSMPAIFPDSIEVLIYTLEAGCTLVGAIELVSPANKDRPESRRAFAAKCAAYLQQGIGVLISDVVTNRRANLHNELIDLLNVGGSYRLTSATELYAVSYRPHRTETESRIDIWHAAMRVGESLPQLPLALDKGLTLPLDLEQPYVEACRRSRLL
jgi:hypothetical protein